MNRLIFIHDSIDSIISELKELEHIFEIDYSEGSFPFGMKVSRMEQNNEAYKVLSLTGFKISQMLQMLEKEYEEILEKELRDR